MGGERGYSYVDDSADRFYFVTPLSDGAVTVDVDSGTHYVDTIIGSDLDSDGETEFLWGMDNTTSRLVVELKVSSSSIVRYPVLLQSIDQILVGDFDADGGLDLAAVDKSAGKIVIVDRDNGGVLGTYQSASAISCVDVGDYNVALGDEISVAASKDVTIISGTASALASTVLPHAVTGMTTFQYGVGVDDVAIFQSVGNVTVLEGSALSTIYDRAFAASSVEPTFLASANITLDGQTDLVISLSELDQVYFLDGSDGAVLYSRVTGVNVDAPPGIGTVDRDDRDDVVTLTSQDRLCFLHGSSSEIAFVASEVEGSTRAYAYDIDADGRDDMLAVAGRDIYVRLSDTTSPVLEPSPVWPLHPTVVDDYVKIEVGVTEDSSVERAVLHIRAVGDLGWASEGLEASTSGRKYLTFLVGLSAGQYEYYIEIVDAYLNPAYVGGPSSPLQFEVTGHLAWEYEMSYPYEMRTRNVMAVGNTSTGEIVLYTASVEPGSGGGYAIMVRKFRPNGTVVQAVELPLGSNYNTQFALLASSNNLDNVVDLQLVTANSSRAGVYLIDGKDITSYTYDVATRNIRALTEVFVFDDDGDGLDDTHIVDDSAVAIVRRGSSGGWTNTPLTSGGQVFSLPLRGAAWSQTGENGSYQIAVLLNDTLVQIYDATNLSRVKEENIALEPSYTDASYGRIASYHNSTMGHDQFLYAITLWRGAVADTRLYLFDVQTQNISASGKYTLDDYHFRSLYLYDLEPDGLDDLFMVDTDGLLSLMRLGPSLDVEWTVSIGDATPSGYAIADFDGFNGPELVVFTKQDKTLHSITLSDQTLRDIVLARAVYNPVPVGNVDPGGGEDIAAFPVLEPYRMYAGVVRDLDWYYRLDYSVSFSSTQLVQGDTASLSVTVTNIYGESLSNASVTAIAHYNLGGEETKRSYGLVYDAVGGHYTAQFQVNWPMGLVNMTLQVTTDYYHPISGDIIGNLTVRSPLTVTVHAPESATQGQNATVYVSVTDSLGIVISDAAVNVTIDNTVYQANFSDPAYEVFLSTVTFPPGDYLLNATADHRFATGVASATTQLRVVTDTLVVVTDIPSVVEQDTGFSGWLNLTDQYSNALSGATVKLKSGSYEFVLSEVVAGSYRLDDSANLPIGRYNFTVIVEDEYVVGTEFGMVTISVYGNLTASVSHPLTVEGGSHFNVSAYVYDSYGTTPDGILVKVEFNGVNYTAISTGGAGYRAVVTANTSIGSRVLLIYVSSTYGHPQFTTSTVEVVSNPVLTMDSSGGWTLSQGDSTDLSVTVFDWSGTPVSDATVTMLSPVSLVLSHIVNGTYAATFSTAGYAPGEYEILISVAETYLHANQTSRRLIVLGIVDVSVEYETPARNDAELNLTFVVTDAYSNPVSSFDYAVGLAGQGVSGSMLNSHTFSWLMTPGVPPGLYQLWVNISGSYVVPVNKSLTMAIVGVPSVAVVSPAYMSNVTQGATISFELNLTDLIGTQIDDAEVVVSILGSPYLLAEVQPGRYAAEIGTAIFPLGLYTASISVTHPYLESIVLQHRFRLVGSGVLALDYPAPLMVGDNITFTALLSDDYAHPITGYSWDAIFQGVRYQGTVGNDSSQFSIQLSLAGPPGVYYFVVETDSPFVTVNLFNVSVEVRSTLRVRVISPAANSSFVQGTEPIEFRVSVADALGNPMSSVTVGLTVRETLFYFESLGNGTYVRTVTTDGWTWSQYVYEIEVSDSLADTAVVNGTVNILARPQITITTSTLTPQQGSDLLVRVEVKDAYGAPVLGLDIVVTFANRTVVATESETPGVYVAIFDNINARHGDYQLEVHVGGTTCIPASDSLPLSVVVPVPQITLTGSTFILGTGLSLVISLIGMFIYFRVAGMLSARGKEELSVRQSVTRLDRVYLLVLGGGGMVLLHSIYLGTMGSYGLALAESILLIGISVLLYGIWLYRDAYSSILITERVSRRRVLAGLWHLALVPGMIYQIIEYGRHIELFQVYILENVFHLGEIAVPAILLTVFGTYVSSIVVVVVNLYREIRKGLGRIQAMRTAGTPPRVIEEERELLVQRTGTSIRTKFLMFLIVVGAATASSLDFIRSYSLAVIILFPIVFLVVIPYLSSKIVTGVPKLARRIRRRSADNRTEVRTYEVPEPPAIEVHEVEEDAQSQPEPEQPGGEDDTDSHGDEP